MKRRSFLKGATLLGLSPARLRPIHLLEPMLSDALKPAEGNTESEISTREPITISRPVDHGEALLNPGMGWNFPYYTDNQDARYGDSRPENDTLDWFPGANAVYFRVGWSHIETTEGKFNWEYTDRVAQHWIAKQKQVAYCWIVFSTGGTVSATPKWLKETGALGWYFPWTNGKPEPQWVPNWDDPIFLKKFGNFLAAASERYDGKPYIQFIEIGSLGTWGEGHTFTGFDTRETSIPPITADAQKKHLNLWKQHFPNTVLLINDDYESVPWNPTPSVNNINYGSVEYASSLGYGLTDWSIMVQAYRPYLSGELAKNIWPNEPIGLENEHYGYAYRRGSWMDGIAYLDAMERYHASFLRIHWWPDEFLNGNGQDLPGNFELVKRMNQRVGYRLQVVEAKWPSRIKAGATLTCNISWRNAGVAPCYKGGFPAISLLNSRGVLLVHGIDKTFDVRGLPPGPSIEQAPIVAHNICIQVPHTLAAGDYNLGISVESKDGLYSYKLPITEFDDCGRYRLGRITIYS